jgi:membrane-bound lytic murein transglycosylase B
MTANASQNNTENNPASDLTFDQWLTELRAEASLRGISAETLDVALSNLEAPIPRVIELDNNQPEFVQTFTRYMRNRISQQRVSRGRELLKEHAELFELIQQRYGVQAPYLVSFWALESNFGDFTGGFSVIQALSTLAYDPRRSQFFRDELLTALEIIDSGHIQSQYMTGSWAGAMGQCQFMPSTFARYGVDGDGDGRIDIWNSLPDIFASAANFLSESGWKGDERWGREVRLPKNFDYTLSGQRVTKTVSEGQSLNVKRADGTRLGHSDQIGSIVLPSGANGPAFITYNNFRTTMIWNRSTFYAISVGHLADRIAGEGTIRRMPEKEERGLSRQEVTELQQLLMNAGINTGNPDGILGSKTREAVKHYQHKNGLLADGYASYALLANLRSSVLQN